MHKELVENIKTFYTDFDKFIGQVQNNDHGEITLDHISETFKTIKITETDYLFVATKILPLFRDFIQFDHDNRNNSSKPEDNPYLILIIRILNSKYSISHLYENSLLLGIFSCRNIIILQEILEFNQMNIIPYFKDKLFSLSTLQQALMFIKENRKKETGKFQQRMINDCYELANKIVNLQFISKSVEDACKIIDQGDLESFEMTIVLKDSLSVDFVRGLIRMCVCDDLDKQQHDSTSVLVQLICLTTFPKLSKENIQLLKDDYLSLLPFIFKYNSRSTRLNRVPVLYYYKIHYGTIFIGELTMQYFRKWTAKIVVSKSRQVLNAVGALKCLSIESDTVYQNHSFICNRLVTALKVISHKELHTHISLVLSEIIGQYKQFDNQLAIECLHVIQNECFVDKVLGETNTKSQSPAQLLLKLNENYILLFDAICRFNPSSISDQLFDNYLNYLNNVPIRNNNDFVAQMNIISTLVLARGDQFKDHKEFEQCYSNASKDGLLGPSLKMFVFYTDDLETLENKNVGIGNSSQLSFKGVLELREKIINLSIQQKKSINETLTNDLFVRAMGRLCSQMDKLQLLRKCRPFLKGPMEINLLFENIGRQLFVVLAHPSGYIDLIRRLLDMGEIFMNAFLMVVENTLKLVQQLDGGRVVYAYFYLLDRLKRVANLDKYISTVLLNYSKIKPKPETELIYEPLQNISIRLLLSLANNIYQQFIDQYFESLIIQEDSLSNLLSFHHSLFQQINNSLTVLQSKEHYDEYIIKKLLKSSKPYTLASPFDYSFKKEYVAFIMRNIVELSTELTTIAPKYLSRMETMLAICNENNRKFILKTIHVKKIACLQMLIENAATKLGYDPRNQTDDFSQYTPQIQNLVIQNILRFFYMDQTILGRELINLAQVSKTFFRESLKLVQKIPRHFTFSRIIDTGNWSLLANGIYHIKYSQLRHFHFEKVESIIYKQQSLVLDQPIFYQFNRELSELTHLTIDSHSLSIPYFPLYSRHQFTQALFQSSVISLLDHCHELKEVKLIMGPHLTSRNIGILENIKLLNSFLTCLEKILDNNHSSLQVIKISFIERLDSEQQLIVLSILDKLDNFKRLHPKFTFFTNASYFTSKLVPLSYSFTPSGSMNTNLLKYVNQLRISDMVSIVEPMDTIQYLTNLTKLVLFKQIVQSELPQNNINWFSSLTSSTTLPIKQLVLNNFTLTEMVLLLTNCTIPYIEILNVTIMEKYSTINTLLDIINKNPLIMVLTIHQNPNSIISLDLKQLSLNNLLVSNHNSIYYQFTNLQK
ncbi:hypothetical protein DLAC_06624 [Tieghemostelium lacteum]|uniref:Uncharacterized protein n=1 Tax=Tieghemostelium lacteum TaxID=361077 RepID=A0A151ZF85_TIELA|nr:hypothetical protein DLAC_06624 [Tieghemostelium lacteum]|eukprot:KYQ92628.1 hypothetical protein DLAC_06624 [Tieghemostelium lacteum]